MSKQKTPGRPSGRPPDQVRERLMEAARALFARNEFTAVSVKRIARRAGVNGAMIHYYFGDKRGLYLAIAEEVLGPLLEHLGARAEPEDFIRGYTEVLMANPWWPGFLLREVVFGADDFRAEFAARFGERVRSGLLAPIARRVERGEMRADLDPRLTLMSLIGLVVFPFLARPLASRVLGVDLDQVGAAALAQHTQALFRHGVIDE